MFFSKPRQNNEAETLAAVDLGSNSFHLVVARADDNGLHVLDKLVEMVRLGAGLDENNDLTPESRGRALDCLEKFGQRLHDIPAKNVRVVGTNTLRKARNTQDFLGEAEKRLGHEIEIISGIEEARLIYLGVSHSLAEDGLRRLVIDIGGGSTEAIIGEQFRPLRMESLYMGCVSMSRKFFPNGAISKQGMRDAETTAMLELEGIARDYQSSGWQQAVGASGTIKAINKVVRAQGWSDTGISRKSMKQLRKHILQAEHVDSLTLSGLSVERRPVFLGGFAVLNAIFTTLDIAVMEVSDGAVREGLIYDMLGTRKHEDVCEHTITTMRERYHVDTVHADRVSDTALNLLKNSASDWQLEDDEYARMLSWAASSHEIGLTIAHAGYHKHSAYILGNSDMPGFSVQKQTFLSTLVRCHRGKLSPSLFDDLPKKQRNDAIRLVVLLRLAVVLQRNRLHQSIPEIPLRAKGNALMLDMAPEWVERNSLIIEDLQREKDRLAAIGIQLEYKNSED